MADISRSVLAVILLIATTIVAGAIEQKSGLRDVQANQILTDIMNLKTVSYDRVRIAGDINLSGQDTLAAKPIAASIHITNSEINGALCANNTVFSEEVDFENTRFNKPASFFGARFCMDANFKASQFNDTTIFGNAQFNRTADFGKARFEEDTSFWSSKFRNGPANFEETFFNRTVRFWGAYFDVDETDLGWSKFNGPASFWGASFTGDASFTGALFNESADFTLVTFGNSVDFLGTRFEKELFFTDLKFRDLKANWASFSNKLICDGPMYLALIKNFKELEQFEDADSCYYQYRNWKRDQREPGWSKLFDYLAWISCGYGVRWQYTILSGLLVMALFGIYFELRYLAGATANVLLRKRSESTSFSDLWRSVKKSLSFSAAILLSLPSDWYPYGKDEYSKSVKSHLISAVLERMIGWGLMLLLIGTLTRLMVRY